MTPNADRCVHPLNARRHSVVTEQVRLIPGGGGTTWTPEWVCTVCDYEHPPEHRDATVMHELSRRERKAARQKPCGACGALRPRFRVAKSTQRDFRDGLACSEQCARALAVRYTIEIG